jgi:hypothetical protein
MQSLLKSMTHKSKRILSRIIQRAALLACILAVWFVFFYLYNLSGVTEPDFKPLFFVLTGIYVVLEIEIVIFDILIGDNQKDPEQSEIILKLVELSKSIESKHHSIDS